MTIPRNLSKLAEGANSSGVLGVSNGGTGLPSLGTAGQSLVVNSTATGLEYSTPSVASPPYGGLMPIVYSGSPNTITTQGATWLKSGVVAPSTTYPNAPSAPFLNQNDNLTTNTYNITSTKYPAYGAGQWVYPITDGVLISPDLNTWTFVSIPGITATTQLNFINSKFVMIEGSTVYQSTNGSTWTSANSMPASGTWIRPIWNGSYYITGNQSSTYIAYSTDLTTWTQVNISVNPYCIVYGGGYVVVGCMQNTIQYSTNGTSYTSVNVSQGNAASALVYTSIAYASGRWVALSGGTYDSGYSYIYQWSITTTNPSSWSGPSQSITQYDGKVGAIGSTFYVIGQQSIYTQFSTYGYYSTNGSSWTSLDTQYVSYYAYPPRGNGGGALATDGIRTVMGTALTVNSGTSWGTVNLALGSLQTAGMAYNAGTYILSLYAAPSNGNSRQFGYSTDGINWQIRPINDYGGQYNSVVYFNSKWILGGDAKYNITSQPNAIYSSDTLTWSNSSGGAYGKLTVVGSYVIASPYYSGEGTYYTYSSDGVNYSGNSLPTSGLQGFFAYGNSTYMAINRADRVYTATGPTGTWTNTYYNSFTEQPIGLFFAYNAFFVIAQNGAVWKSTNNGVNWTRLTVSGTNDIGSSLQWASFDGTYIVASASGTRTYLATSDGNNWFWRKTASLSFGSYGSVANGYVSEPSMSTGTLSFSVNYVLNDTAQYAYTGSGSGTQMYMRVA